MNCNKITNKNEKYKFVQALIHPTTHKILRILAVEQDMTLSEIVQEIIESYIFKIKQKENK